jgi:hypothetical protein
MRISKSQYAGLLAGRGEKRSRRSKPAEVELGGVVMEPGYLLLVVPLPPSKNREPSNRWARQTLKKQFEKRSYDAWLLAGMPRFEAVTITLRFCVWNLRDADNGNGLGIKGIIDGLKGHLIPDDAPKFLELASDVCEVDRGCQRLELHIEERRT